MPTLSREVETDLARRWRDNRDRRAHDQLIMSQKGNILFLAGKYLASSRRCGCHNGHLEFDDLVQAGWRGVSRASKDFDPERGIRFSTYSIYWIRHYMGRVASAARNNAVMTTSIEFPVSGAERESLTLGDVLPTDGRELVKSECGLIVHSYLKTWLRFLNDRERHIIKSRYLGKTQPTLRILGKELGLSRERIRQIEELALAKIRRYVAIIGAEA